MSPAIWIPCLLGFAFLFWLVARGKGGQQRKRKVQAQQEITELRHVVAEMAMEKHHSRHR